MNPAAHNSSPLKAMYVKHSAVAGHIDGQNHDEGPMRDTMARYGHVVVLRSMLRKES